MKKKSLLYHSKALEYFIDSGLALLVYQRIQRSGDWTSVCLIFLYLSVRFFLNSMFICLFFSSGSLWVFFFFCLALPVFLSLPHCADHVDLSVYFSTYLCVCRTYLSICQIIYLFVPFLSIYCFLCTKTPTSHFLRPPPPPPTQTHKKDK